MKRQTTILRGVAIGGLLLCSITVKPSNVTAAIKTWNSTTTTDWGTNGNWSASGVPAATDDLVFRSNTSTVNSVDMNGAARLGGTLTFNSNQTAFEITGLSEVNTLTLNAPTNSTTTADITVASGNPVIDGNSLFTGSGSTSAGNLIATGLTSTDYFVVEIASGASLDIQASASSTSNSNSRLSRLIKRGNGTLTFSAPTNFDFRPQASGADGGIFINEGTLQLAAEGARGNSFAPLTIASGAMLEFMGAGFDGFIGDVGDRGNRSILTLSGTGVAGKGAIYNSVGDNTLASGGNTAPTGRISSGIMVIASGGASVGVESDTSLTLSHGITNFGAWANDIANGGSGTAGALTKTGGGTLIFDANNNSPRNGYSQQIIVSEGQFLVNSPSVGLPSPLVGDIIGSSGATIVLADSSQYANIYVGQPISGDGIAPGTVVAGVGTAGIRISEEATAATGVSLTFGAVTSALNTSPVSVNGGATLGGTGSILGSAVTIDDGGFLSPGNSIGVFTVGSAAIDGSLVVEIDETDALINDLLVVAGNLDLTGANAVFDITGALTLPSYLLATYGGTLTNAFDPSDAPAGYYFDYSTPGQISLSIVPEPGAMILASMGIIGMGLFRRRQIR